VSDEIKEYSAFRDHVLTVHCIDCDAEATGYLCVRATMIHGTPGFLLGVSKSDDAEVHTFARIRLDQISGVTALRMPKPPGSGTQGRN
jgi:hypothetical protein